MIVLFLMIMILMWICLSYYLFLKSHKEYQVIQQSGYDVKRYLKHIKENGYRYLALNEFILFFTFFVYKQNFLISFLIIAVILYYNTKFFQMEEKRFVSKKALVITKRVQRLLAVETILFLIFTIVLAYFNCPIAYILIIYTYFLPLFMILGIVITTPIEKIIREKFKRMAVNKLRENKNLTVIGITGSFGKTSIKNIINDVLSNYEPTLSTPSSFNTPNGISITVNNNLSILHKNFIAEMGAYYQGEIKELTIMCNPSVAIVSSIGNQHLETFKTIENIQKTKMELVEYMAPNGVAILNMDEKYIREYQIQRSDITKLTYGIEISDVDVTAKEIDYNIGKMSFVLVDNQINKEYNVETKLLGIYNVYNILAAYLVAKQKNIPGKDIIELIKKINPIDHRLELKIIDDNTIIIDDAFNGNIRGISEGLEIIDKYRNFGYQAVIITPGLIDLGNEQKTSNNKVAELIKKKTDYSFIVGNYNREHYEEILKDDPSVVFDDNFIDSYNKVMQIKGKKVILIANDLPDKFN